MWILLRVSLSISSNTSMFLSISPILSFFSIFSFVFCTVLFSSNFLFTLSLYSSQSASSISSAFLLLSDSLTNTFSSSLLIISFFVLTSIIATLWSDSTHLLSAVTTFSTSFQVPFFPQKLSNLLVTPVYSFTKFSDCFVQIFFVLL
eukprot:Phypoly_transcript_02268.p1 GENE.Phypoly_transcript_02268~~Phypoly_transcript_02268.p1  ORF type:complete len:147 (+),score=16.54 Phypoly_transcript_02268:1551-1991(+)